MEPLPPEYYHYDEDQHVGHRKWIIAGVLGSAVAVVLLISFLRSNSGQAEPRVQEAPVPEDLGPAPPGDLFIDLQPIGETGAAVEALVADFGPGRVVEGSATIVAGARTQQGAIRLVIWDVQFDGIRSTCFGVLQDNGASASCGLNDGADGGPTIVGGSSSSGERGASFYSIEVGSVPANGIWLVGETDNGTRVVSPIIDGIGYTESTGSRLQTVTVLDRDFQAIWSDEFQW